MVGNFAVTLAAVLFGNALTWGIIYAIMRIRRNEHDKPAVFIMLFCFFFIGATGYALHELQQEAMTAQVHSERQ